MAGHRIPGDTPELLTALLCPVSSLACFLPNSGCACDRTGHYLPPSPVSLKGGMALHHNGPCPEAGWIALSGVCARPLLKEPYTQIIHWINKWVG